MIRTTISLPQDIYEQVRLQAFNQKMSLGKVIAQSLRHYSDSNPKEKETAQKLAEAKFKEDIAFFNSVGEELKGIDLLAELRKDRDRDNA